MQLPYGLPLLVEDPTIAVIAEIDTSETRSWTNSLAETSPVNRIEVEKAADPLPQTCLDDPRKFSQGVQRS